MRSFVDFLSINPKNVMSKVHISISFQCYQHLFLCWTSSHTIVRFNNNPSYQLLEHIGNEVEAVETPEPREVVKA